MPEPDEFRWQALFQRTTEPLFLLDRQRRVRFVNRAWEALTGFSLTQAKGLVCRRRREAEPGSPEAVAHALAPPPEVLAGQPSRARRLIAGSEALRRWWDVEFFPLRDGSDVCAVLGKITAVTGGASRETAPLPEKLIALREKLTQRHTFDSLAGSLPTQRRLVDQVRLASQTRTPVLIVGAPGTGKKWTARVIHHQGTARERTFATLDCVRLPPVALASALFGSTGLLGRVNVGTLYLKEIASLPRDFQARLAEHLVEPIGPRIVVGLSTDPAEEVRAGRLLEDLHTALSTLVLALSPLRDRRADLPMLVDRLLEQAEPGADGRRVSGLAPDAWDVIHEYRWPGNLDELAAVLDTACRHAKSPMVEAADLPAYVRQAVRLDQEPGRAPDRPLPLADLMQQVERRLITLALHMAKGNKSRAAELLSLSRGSLLNRMERLGIKEGE